MANGARLILKILIVRRADGQSRCEIGRRRVALQAQSVHICSIEQARIWTSVRTVAGCATFSLDHVVFIHKRAGRFGVALGAHSILLRAGLEALLAERSVRIVAVRAFYESFFHLVMERHVELRLGVGVALEA